MLQTNVIPDWKLTYPNDAKCQKPSGMAGTVTRTASAAVWATGTVTLTVPAVLEPAGAVVPITVSGFTPAGYNGSYTGTIASPTSITYPLTSNPGAETALGQVSYQGVIPITISTTLSANDVPNKFTPYTGMLMAETEAEAEAEMQEASVEDDDVVELEDESEPDDEEVEEEDENGNRRTVTRKRTVTRTTSHKKRR